MVVISMTWFVLGLCLIFVGVGLLVIFAMKLWCGNLDIFCLLIGLLFSTSGLKMTFFSASKIVSLFLYSSIALLVIFFVLCSLFVFFETIAERRKRTKEK